MGRPRRVRGTQTQAIPQSLGFGGENEVVDSKQNFQESRLARVVGVGGLVVVELLPSIISCAMWM